MRKKIFLIGLLLLRIVFSIQGQDLHLYGGIKYNEYLGCITCNKFNSDSIWNKFGNYGSKFSSISIWNKFGEYGSKFSSYSPWNKFSSNPPAIIDKNGNFYGFFTINTLNPKRTKIEYLIWILDNHEWIIENFDEAIDLLF